MAELKDSRVQGHAAEAILVSLLNSIEHVHAVQLDTVGFDVIAWDSSGNVFPAGRPVYIQLKLRMSNNSKFTTQGHNPKVIQRVKEVAKELGVHQKDCYFCVAFAKDADVRTCEFFMIPLRRVEQFRKPDEHYRFSHKKCCEKLKSARIIKL